MRRFAVSLALAFLPLDAAAQPCVPHWSDQYPPGRGLALGFACEVFDLDGAGPLPRRLYVAAESIGPIEFGGVGQFDGVTWSRVGNVGDVPDALMAFDDGGGPTLFAGGAFGLLVRWDGQQWQDIGVGFDVWELGTWDPDGNGPKPAVLVAAGWADIGDQLLLTWDGTHWSPFPGTQFFELEHPTLEAVADYDPDGDGPEPASFYLGGDFWKINDQVLDNIARWDGNQWHSMGGANDDVRDLVVFDEDGTGPLPPSLFAMGGFTQVNGQPILGVARWDGSAWSPVGPGLIDGHTFEADVLDSDGPGPGAAALYVRGRFTLADGTPSSLATWDGSTWRSIVRTDQYGLTGASYFDADGGGPGQPSLFITGGFTSVEGVPSEHIAELVCAAQVCYPDLDLDGALTLFDFLRFVNLVNSGDAGADCTADGSLDLFDFLCFTNAFNAGC